MKYQIVPQRPQDAALIEPLLDQAFGPDRSAKTVYRLREGLPPIASLCFVAVGEDTRMLASLEFWAIRIVDLPAILLGPLAVDPLLRGRGIGKALVRHGLLQAKRQGHRICVVVGEPEYYTPYGFVNAGAYGLVLPGPVDPRRFQVLELRAGALEGPRGLIARAEPPPEDDNRQGAVA